MRHLYGHKAAQQLLNQESLGTPDKVGFLDSAGPLSARVWPLSSVSRMKATGTRRQRRRNPGANVHTGLLMGAPGLSSVKGALVASDRRCREAVTKVYDDWHRFSELASGLPNRGASPSHNGCNLHLPALPNHTLRADSSREGQNVQPLRSDLCHIRLKPPQAITHGPLLPAVDLPPRTAIPLLVLPSNNHHS